MRVSAFDILKSVDGIAYDLRLVDHIEIYSDGVMLGLLSTFLPLQICISQSWKNTSVPVVMHLK